MKTFAKYILLITAFFIYSCSGIFSKYASMQEFLSLPYIAFISGVVFVLGVYAIMWQQIIKRMPVGDAYLFKGTGVVFGLLIAHFIFGEAITLNNVIGSAVIIAGITLNTRA